MVNLTPNSAYFKNFNPRQNKIQLLILILLVLTLPLAVYVALRQTYFKGKAAATSTLSLVPQGVSQVGGVWQFPLNQTVAVNFVVTAGTSSVEAAEGVIKYDPTVLSVPAESSITYNTATPLKEDTLKCSNIHILRDAGGLETGVIHISRTSISPLPSCDTTGRTDTTPAENTPPVNVPLNAGTASTLATINFTILKVTSNSTITLDYNSDPELSGSHISAYQGAGAEDLASVMNVTFAIVEATPTATPTTAAPTPTLTLTPTSTPPNTPTPTQTPTPVPSATATLTPTATTIPVSPTIVCTLKSQGDASCDGIINMSDFGIWKNTYAP